MTALRTTTIALCIAIITAAAAFAGPPLATDDAGTVKPGKVEVELNGSYTQDKEAAGGITTRRNSTDAEVKITTGLYKNLGMSLAIPYTVTAREDINGAVATTDGFGDMTLEIKYVFAELADIYFAVKPSLIIPTGKYSASLSEGGWQPGITLIATMEFYDGSYALHANLGYEHHSYRDVAVRNISRSNLLSGSIAGEAKLMTGLTGVIDFGWASNRDNSSGNLPVYALTGVRYEINDRLDINAGVKVGLTKPEDDVSLLYGLMVKF